MNTRLATRRFLLLLAAASMGPATGFAAPQQPSAQPESTPARPAQVADANSNDPQQPALHQRYPRYRLRSSDVIDLTFRFTPEFNQEVTVQPDGYIQARGLPNDVYVQGLTVSELTATLQKAYGSILNEPEISVTLKDFD